MTAEHEDRRDSPRPAMEAGGDRRAPADQALYIWFWSRRGVRSDSDLEAQGICILGNR